MLLIRCNLLTYHRSFVLEVMTADVLEVSKCSLLKQLRNAVGRSKSNSVAPCLMSFSLAQAYPDDFETMTAAQMHPNPAADHPRLAGLQPHL